MAALMYLVMSADALTLHDGATRLHHLGADIVAAMASYDEALREAEEGAVPGPMGNEKVLVELLEVVTPFTSADGFVAFYRYADAPEGVKVLDSNNEF